MQDDGDYAEGEDALVRTLVSVGIHGLLLAALLMVLVAVVPKFGGIFESFGTEFSPVTAVIVGVAQHCLNHIDHALLACVGILVVDGVVGYSLRRGGLSSAARLWGILFAVMVGLVAVVIVVGLFLPLVWLMTSVGQQAQ